MTYLHLFLGGTFVKLALALHTSVQSDLLKRKRKDELRIIDENLPNLHILVH